MAAVASVSDQLLLFLYLEAMSMLERCPLFIDIGALARHMVREIKDLDVRQILAVVGALFILAMPVLAALRACAFSICGWQRFAFRKPAIF